MACHCSNCSKSKRISTLRQLQVEKCVKPKSHYPKKSKKIHMDRYMSARQDLLRTIRWFKESHDRGRVNGRYSFYHRPITRKDWGVKEYREARKIVKELGLI